MHRTHPLQAWEEIATKQSSKSGRRPFPLTQPLDRALICFVLQAWEEIATTIKKAGVTFISLDQAAAAVRKGTPVVDVRPRNEFKGGRIPGAVNCEVRRVGDAAAGDGWLGPNQRLLLLCVLLAEGAGWLPMPSAAGNVRQQLHAAQMNQNTHSAFHTSPPLTTHAVLPADPRWVLLLLSA